MKNFKILIAEDEKALAKILIHKLKLAGLQAEAVFDGEEALEKLENNKYDVLLLDIIMPKVDGYEVLEALQGKENKPYIIVNSNLSQNSDIQKALDLGADKYLEKTKNQLTNIVDFIILLAKKNN